MKRVLVITANMGGACSNTMITQLGYEVDFICFDKTNFATRENAMHPRLLGKIPKMLAWEYYPEYDIYIWIDGGYSIKNPYSVKWLIEQLGDKDALFFVHPARTTIKDELFHINDGLKNNNMYLISRYNGEDMDSQVKYYLNDISYKDNLLIACGLFVYTDKLVSNREHNVLKEWFYHNCRFSVQDQLSLPYLLNKFNINYNLINKNIYQVLNNEI